MQFFVMNHREGYTKIIRNIPVTTDKLIYEIVINYVIFNRAQYVLNPPTGTELEWCVAKLIKNDNIFCQLFINPVLIFYRGLHMYRNIHCVPPERRQNFISCLGLDSFSTVDTNTGKCEEWSEEVFRNILLL